MSPTARSDELVRVLVGPDQREFFIHNDLLCESSDYFSESLAQLSPSSSLGSNDNDLIMWMPAESPGMFRFFVLYLYHGQPSFAALLANAIAAIAPSGSSYDHSRHRHCLRSTTPNGGKDEREQAREAVRDELHWNLVRLHLFAAMLEMWNLQDTAMDALQDLYLRCDWDVSPRLVTMLYADCDAETSAKLRQWAIAMLAWKLDEGHMVPSSTAKGTATIPPAAVSGDFKPLFDAHPELRGDYIKHVTNMAANRTNVAIKNPQLRLPGNGLRSEERHFGFRQCSFHTHRRAVGQGPCLLLSTVMKRARYPSSGRRGRSRHVKTPSVETLEEEEIDENSDSGESLIMTPVDAQPTWDAGYSLLKMDRASAMVEPLRLSPPPE